MHIFTWRKRKKVFHPNGELNWNILLPSSSTHNVIKSSISSPQLSLSDKGLKSPPSNSGPYFLPTKQLRPSFQHLLSVSADSSPETSPTDPCPDRVLSTFQPDIIPPNQLLKQRVQSERSLLFNNSGDNNAKQERSSSAASVLLNHRRQKKSNERVCVSEIYDDRHCKISQENFTEQLEVVLSRSPGEKLGLGLSIQTHPNTDLVQHVFIRSTANCQALNANGDIWPGDEILLMNGSDVRTYRKPEFFDLFKNAPLTFTLLIQKAKRHGLASSKNALAKPDSGGILGSQSRVSFCSTLSLPAQPSGGKPKRPSVPPPPPPLHGHERCLPVQPDKIVMDDGFYDDVADLHYENIYDTPCGEPDANTSEDVTAYPCPTYARETDGKGSATPECLQPSTSYTSEIIHKSAPNLRPAERVRESVEVAASDPTAASSRTSAIETQLPPNTELDALEDESLYCDTLLIAQMRQEIRNNASDPSSLIKRTAADVSPDSGFEVMDDHVNVTRICVEGDNQTVTPEKLQQKRQSLRHIEPVAKAAASDCEPRKPHPVSSGSSCSAFAKDFILACDDLMESSVDELEFEPKVSFANEHCGDLEEDQMTVAEQDGLEKSTRNRADKFSLDARISRIRSILKSSPWKAGSELSQPSPLVDPSLLQSENVSEQEQEAGLLSAPINAATGQIRPCTPMDHGQDFVSATCIASKCTDEDLFVTTDGSDHVSSSADVSGSDDCVFVDHPGLLLVTGNFEIDHRTNYSAGLKALVVESEETVILHPAVEGVRLQPSSGSDLIAKANDYPAVSRLKFNAAEKADQDHFICSSESRNQPQRDARQGWVSDPVLNALGTDYPASEVLSNLSSTDLFILDQESADIQNYYSKNRLLSENLPASVCRRNFEVSGPEDTETRSARKEERISTSLPVTNGQIPSSTSLSVADKAPKTNIPLLTNKPIPPPKPEFLQRPLKIAERELCHPTKESKTNSPYQSTNNTNSSKPASAPPPIPTPLCCMLQQNSNIRNAPIVSGVFSTPVKPLKAAAPPHHLEATAKNLYRAHYVETVEEFGAMEDLLIDFTSSDLVFPTAPAMTSDVFISEFSSESRSDFPLCLEPMRESTDSGHAISAEIDTLSQSLYSTNSPEYSRHSRDDTSLDTNSDAEDNSSLSNSSTEIKTYSSDFTIPEPEAHMRDIEVLHMSWDIGLKIKVDRESRCVIQEVCRNSPLARLGNVKEGDFLDQINGQCLDGMSEIEISTMLRALPRGVVKMAVCTGKKAKKRDSVRSIRDKRDSVYSVSTLAEVADPDPFDDISDSIGSFSSPAMSSYSRHSYSREVNYGMSRPSNASSQSSTTIEPVARTEFSRSKTAHIGEPAEFIVKIQKEYSSENERGPSALRHSSQHNSSYVYHEPGHEPLTFDLTPSAPPTKSPVMPSQNGYSTQPKTSYRQNSFSSSFDQENEKRHSDTPAKSGVIDPYKIGRDLVSDDFKKKREKFLGGTESDGKSGQKFPSNSGMPSMVADRRSVFAAAEQKSFTNGNSSYVPGNFATGAPNGNSNKFGTNGTNVSNGTIGASQTFPKSAFSQMQVRYDQKPMETHVTEYNREERRNSGPKAPHIPPVANKPSPPVTQASKAYKVDRGRSSSISSVTSNSSANSFSSSDPSRQEIRESKQPNGTLEHKISNGSMRERTTESLDRGRISPAQLSRMVAKKEVSGSVQNLSGLGATTGRFSEALARYKAKTELGNEELQGGVTSQRRGSKPLVVPVAANNVMNRASIFERKASEEAANGGSPLPSPAPVPLSSTSRLRSMSSTSLPASSTARQWSTEKSDTGRKALQMQPEEETVTHVESWRSKRSRNERPAEPPRTSSITPTPNGHLSFAARDSPSTRHVRDSGVSSSNSSMGSPDLLPASPDHKVSIPEEVFDHPAAPAVRSLKHLNIQYDEHDELDHFPPPPEMLMPEPVEAEPIPLASLASSVAAVQSGPARAAEEAAARRRAARNASLEQKETETFVQPAPVKVEETGGRDSSLERLGGSVSGSSGIGSSSVNSDDDGQLVAMGKRFLGGDAEKYQVFLVNLVRPDGAQGGGVGIVLTGGADYENNPIKVNKVITHSLAHRDGRVQANDRILLINGQPSSNMTHRQALEVLKAPSAEVSLVIARS